MNSNIVVIRTMLYLDTSISRLVKFFYGNDDFLLTKYFCCCFLLYNNWLALRRMTFVKRRLFIFFTL